MSKAASCPSRDHLLLCRFLAAAALAQVLTAFIKTCNLVGRGGGVGGTCGGAVVLSMLFPLLVTGLGPVNCSTPAQTASPVRCLLCSRHKDGRITGWAACGYRPLPSVLGLRSELLETPLTQLHACPVPYSCMEHIKDSSAPVGAGGNPGGLARTGATAGRAAGLGWHRSAGVQQGCSPGACTEAAAASYRPAVSGQCRDQLLSACEGGLLTSSLHMLLLSQSLQGYLCHAFYLCSPSPHATIQPAARCQGLILRCSKLTYGAI